MIEFLIICFIGTYVFKIISHLNYLRVKEDSYFTEQNSLLDSLLPHKQRASYIRLFIATQWFPILKTSGNPKLKSVVNWLVFSLYVQFALIVILIIRNVH